MCATGTPIGRLGVRACNFYAGVTGSTWRRCDTRGPSVSFLPTFMVAFLAIMAGNLIALTRGWIAARFADR